MTPLEICLLLAASVGASAGLTALVRRHKLRKKHFDIANERSMHTIPTPRGGGIAIAIVFTAGVILLAALGLLEIPVAIALAFGGSVIALMGYTDDVVQLPASVRFFIQMLCAVMAVWAVGGVPEIILGPWTLNLGLAGSALAVIVIVWLINLFNFMDGIDGLAGSEGLLVGAMAGIILWSAGRTGGSIAAWVLAAACLGFLFLNWSPAKIFMGDAGSTLIGYLTGTLALYGMKSADIGMFVWLLIVGAFFTDATVTLICRFINKEEVTRPHRTHAFQVAAQKVGRHAPITLAYGAANLFFLFPLAVAAWLWPEWAPLAALAGIGIAAAAVYQIRGGVKGPNGGAAKSIDGASSAG